MTVTGERTAVEVDLGEMIDALITRADGDFVLLSNESWHCRERKAHTLSNQVNPDFLEVDLSCAFPSPDYTCSE
jgi:hypothetical protein